MMLHVCAVARNMSRSKCIALEHGVKNFLYTECETVRLVEAVYFGFAIARTQNRGELAEAVNALVVHLDGNNALELLEDFLEPIRQRMQMTQVQCADFFALISRQCHRVVDRPVS